MKEPQTKRSIICQKMEDDDLEYDITFPSPVLADIGESDGTAFNDRKEPVIFLLGWLGCREKYLAKYGQIYDKRGLVFFT